MYVCMYACIMYACMCTCMETHKVMYIHDALTHIVPEHIDLDAH